MIGAARQSAPVFDVAAVQRVGSRYVEEVCSVKEFVELLAVPLWYPKSMCQREPRRRSFFACTRTPKHSPEPSMNHQNKTARGRSDHAESPAPRRRGKLIPMRLRRVAFGCVRAGC